MAKRKHDPLAQEAGSSMPDAGRETGEPVELATVSVETAPPEVPFELGTWKGLTQWRCRQCPWDTLNGAEAVLAHIQEVHQPPLRPPSPPLIAIADRWGHEVRPAAPGPQDRVSHSAEEE